MEEQTKFNGDLLLYKLIEDYGSFRDLYDFVNEKSIVKNYINSLKIRTSSSSELIESDEEGANYLRELTSSGIYFALNHFGGLSIISICTIYEVAAKEFLCCFFLQNPSHIYEFVGTEEIRGHVSLKEILKVDSYQALLVSLANKSASVATKGSYGQVLLRIGSLCKEDIKRDIVKKLDDLQKLRNKIVHEKFSKTWELTDIEEAENLVSFSIKQICRFGLNNNVPGNYTCVINENRLTDEEFVEINKDAT